MEGKALLIFIATLRFARLQSGSRSSGVMLKVGIVKGFVGGGGGVGETESPF